MIHLHNLRPRLLNQGRRMLTRYLARRLFVRSTSTPYISFTFDDFPRSSFLTGAPLLDELGVKGTFFVSMGLLDTESPMGRIATRDDLRSLLKKGHELGCHTFDHLDGWSTDPMVFEQSVTKNWDSLNLFLPPYYPRVFAYPLDGPRPRTKRIIGKHFLCCRGGGQTFNKGVIDLYLLNACFLDWRNRDDIRSIRRLIDQNNGVGGWLIFATHDITTEPSRYGCTPGFFGEVVRYACQSEAHVLPIAKVCNE